MKAARLPKAAADGGNEHVLQVCLRTIFIKMLKIIIGESTDA